MTYTRIFKTAFFLVLLFSVLAGCKTESGTGSSQSSKKDPSLLVFPGKDTVYKSEFEYVYQKNNGGWDEAKKHNSEQYREYLDLYINFKRKVLEAESLGLHNTESFKTEFEGYRKQLSQPYLVDKDVQEGLVKEAYDRSKVVIAASHLLIMCGPEVAPDDTMKTYQKILSIRDSIVNHGKSFSEMALKYSQDPSVRQNEGYLGYFTVFDMVYPFESGAYNTKVGDVSMPIRSGYGYHLIKVVDRMENTGKKTAAHIIIRVGPQYSAKNEDQAKEKIKEIHEKLKAGANWDELCSNYSDDPNTSKRGGDLGVGRLIPEMEDIKRKLGKGEISEPFESAFGFHIMKVTDVEEVKSFEEAEADLKSRIARDMRSTLSQELLIKRIKRENDFSMNDANIGKFVRAIEDEGKLAQYSKGFWRPVDSLHKDLYGLEVYSIGKNGDKHVGTLKDFFDYYVKARKGLEGVNAQQATDKFMESFVEQEMLNFEERQLPKKHREYRELLKEYRDGILLFTLTEDKVWRKAVEDTTGLKKYYEDHKSDFMAGERIKVTEYISEKKETIEEVIQYLKDGHSEEKIDSLANAKSALACRIRTQTYELGKSAAEDKMFGHQPGFRSEVMPYGNAWRLLVLKENIPSGQKSFDEAKSECITKYQNYLEETWLSELKDKYPVEVDEKVFTELFR